MVKLYSLNVNCLVLLGFTLPMVYSGAAAITRVVPKGEERLNTHKNNDIEISSYIVISIMNLLSSIVFVLLTILSTSKKIRPITDSKLPRAKYLPMNQEQQYYIDCMNDPKTSITICTGSAGSGKSLFAIVHAVQELSNGNIHKIILTRPTVSVFGESELGFLPGNMQDKMSPYTQPLFDILHEYYSKTEVNRMVADDIIEISPLSFMRGRTFKNSIIVADEMQNSTPEQMLMLASRIGTNSRLITTGDLFQSDLGHRNGLSDLLDKLENRKSHSKSIKVVKLCEVLRSPIVKEILDIYNNIDYIDESKQKQRLVHSSKDKIYYSKIAYQNSKYGLWDEEIDMIYE
jgi:phosphate starvation-inducible PhoH-like protein